MVQYRIAFTTHVRTSVPIASPTDADRHSDDSGEGEGGGGDVIVLELFIYLFMSWDPFTGTYFGGGRSLDDDGERERNKR